MLRCSRSMPRIRTELVVAAPPARVFAALADFGSWSAWNPVIPKIRGEARVGSSVRFRIVIPGLVDGHIHLDKTHWGAPRLPHFEGHSVRERIAAERVERHRVALPIEARASGLIRTLIANGTTPAHPSRATRFGIEPLLNAGIIGYFMLRRTGSKR